MEILERRQFGDPILRKVSKRLLVTEILSDEIQLLIKNMQHTLISKKLGVGLAAPQIGQNISLAVIAIRPTKIRPKIKLYDLVIINPKIVKKSGVVKQLWEGCISAGSNGTADLFAKVPRHTIVEVQYHDEYGAKQTKKFTGLKAQIIQHETDHLNGILFVDHVTDTRTYMTYKEYNKNKVKKLQKVT